MLQTNSWLRKISSWMCNNRIKAKRENADPLITIRWAIRLQINTANFETLNTRLHAQVSDVATRIMSKPIAECIWKKMRCISKVPSTDSSIALLSLINVEYLWSKRKCAEVHDFLVIRFRFYRSRCELMSPIE